MTKWVVAGAFMAFVAGALGLAADDAHAARCKPGGGSWFGKGNNGFGNGGFDGVPGRSGQSKAPSAGQKKADRVR